MHAGKTSCQSCKKKCSGEVLRVQDKYFHIGCFKCRVCQSSLAQGGFFCKDGEYFCTKDYQDRFGTKCSNCGLFVEGEVVTALGKTYHSACFTCARCRSFASSFLFFHSIPSFRASLFVGRKWSEERPSSRPCPLPPPPIHVCQPYTAGHAFIAPSKWRISLFEWAECSPQFCSPFLPGRWNAVEPNNVVHQSRQPFPSGERVTFTGKEVLCQKCVHIPVMSETPSPPLKPTRQQPVSSSAPTSPIPAHVSSNGTPRTDPLRLFSPPFVLSSC